MKLLTVKQGLYRLVAVLVILLLNACTQTDRFAQRQDSAPLGKVDPNTIVDAIPREGAVTRAGNKNPYTVLGKTYHLLPSSKGYRAEGIASWYGTKFHGRPTANGEPYSLYGMTAAHRTLPIPAYVKVTNLANMRTAIVRVNDRGPFHSDRVIDLSYAAAVKLGYAEQGTAKVLVEVIDSSKPVSSQPTAQAERYFLQVGAFKSLTLANNLRADLLLKTVHEVSIKTSDTENIYRVHLGPLNSIAKVQQVSEELLQLNIEKPRLITE